MIKINALDAHDRLQHLNKQNFSIEECCQDIVKQEPFGNIPFYIFAHPRTHEDGISKRLIWQPRLSKPKAQTNSMLFKAYPRTDVIEIIWIIPPREIWPQYDKDKLTANELIRESIEKFINNREALEAPAKDDLSEEQMKAIYKEVSQKAKYEKHMEKLYVH